MTEKNDIRTARRVPRATSNEPPDDVTWHDSLRRLPGGTRHGIFDLGYGLLERIVRRGPLTDAHIVLRLTPAAAADLQGGMEAVRRAHTESAQTHLSVTEEGRLRPSERMARHFVLHGERVPAWLGLLGWIEECAWSWDEPRSMPSRPHDRIYRRDGFRCMAPGCTARVRLEAHHLQYRSRGGEDLPENLLVLCLFHHQQGEHGLLARARGWAPLGVTWRLGNTELATWWRNEKKLGAPTSPPVDPRSASRAIA